MLITFTLLIILSIGAFIISMYSAILPFAQNIWNIEQYNQTYYEAYANIEDALLVSKYQEAWFSGSWWFIQGSIRWPQSKEQRENIQESYRTIEWKTTKIPYNPQTKTIYTIPDEKEFAKLTQWGIINIPLTIDATNDYEYYYSVDSGNTIIFNWNQIALTILLPQKVQDIFGWTTITLLCDQEEVNCTMENEWEIVDNIIRDRKIQWKYLGNDFTILPHTNTNDRVEWEYLTVDYTQDTNIREFVINNESNIIPNIVRDNGFNPIKNNTLADEIWKQNSIWAGEEFVQWETFQEIFTSENVQNLSLQIEFNNPAISRNNNRYPFILYKIQSDVAIPNTYYTIQGVSMINDKRVSIQITKPL